MSNIPEEDTEGSETPRVFTRQEREQVRQSICVLPDAAMVLAYLDALEASSRAAKDFWHQLYLDACITTPKQIGAEARFQQAMEKIDWMNE